jgi:nitrite reductase/ring-hydroxylating ferredoxin subunit
MAQASKISIRSLTEQAQEYKLNGISKCDLDNGEKREVEVEGIEGGKVLLVKVGDKTHALSPNCTHYGAPLKNGVVTPDGRLTCPWHGGQTLVSFARGILTAMRSS